MIVVKIMGGLGNQLFQYALGRHLAIKNNTELKLDISFYEKNKAREFKLCYLNTKYSLADISEIPILKGNRKLNKIQKIYYSLFDKKIKICNEVNFYFDKKLLGLPDNYYLFGYWQSEKYFDEIKEIIKNEITIDTKIIKSFIDSLEIIKNNESVSIHVRRGDYINNGTHPVLDITYYLKGLHAIKQNLNQNLTLFIFSDDLDWCRANFKFNEEHYFIEGNKDYEDLYLMSFCKHHIIANSSFSWWGAWLSNYNEKRIVAPENWFQHGINLSTQDLIPQNWIKI